MICSEHNVNIFEFHYYILFLEYKVYKNDIGHPGKPDVLSFKRLLSLASKWLQLQFDVVF